MKIVRRFFSAIVALSIAVSMMIMPASAAEFEKLTQYHLDNFGQFQRVPYNTQYAVAAVAVQKFLMLFGDSYAKELMRYGADGFYGATTQAQVRRFQRQECPHGGTASDEEKHDEYGTVDKPTWLAIADNLKMNEEDDTCGAFIWRDNRSYYSYGTDNVMMWNGTGYYAYNDKDKIPTSTAFYYTR